LTGLGKKPKKNNEEEIARMFEHNHEGVFNKEEF
jgi:hypothetical protein